jgi:hypothetical protein
VVLVQVDVTPCNNCKLPQEVGAGSVLFGKDSGQVLGWRKYMKFTTRLPSTYKLRTTPNE